MYGSVGVSHDRGAADADEEEDAKVSPRHGRVRSPPRRNVESGECVEIGARRRDFALYVFQHRHTRGGTDEDNTGSRLGEAKLNCHAVLHVVKHDVGISSSG